LQITGDPFPVAEGVFMSANTGMAAYAVSSDGRLVYAAGPVEHGLRQPVWVDRRGQPTKIPVEPHAYLHPRLSEDERQLAIEIEGASHNVYVYDFVRGFLDPMSLDGASHWPSFKPGDRLLTYRSWKTGTMTMWTMPVDRSSAPTLLTSIGGMQSPESWSPDGRTLAFTQMDKPEQGSDIYTLLADGKQEPIVQTKFSEGSPKFSPDGRWLAYASDESGRSAVYVMAFPGPGPRISIGSGGDPVWRRDGRELYYRNGDQMMVVEITTRGVAIEASKPTVLWEGKYLAGAGSSCGMSGPTSANYDVTANGERFLMIQDASADVRCSVLRIVSDWVKGLQPPQ
jgi:Tol biopolymer transport system component